jgi:HAD superfamily hydrolase (TIGR01509 family)
MRARDFLFDLDGTLADSAPLHASAFRDALARYAPALACAFDYEPLKGLLTREAFLSLDIGEGPLLEQCVAEKQLLYREAVRKGGLTPFAGAALVLAAVRKRNGRNYLVTSGSADSVSLALDSMGLRECFTGVITADDVIAGKPAPDPYLECLRRFDLDRDGAIAVEDAPAGVASARTAGLRVIGVHNPEAAAMTEFFFKTLGELAAALSRDEAGPDGRAISI